MKNLKCLEKWRREMWFIIGKKKSSEISRQTNKKTSGDWSGGIDKRKRNQGRKTKRKKIDLSMSMSDSKWVSEYVDQQEW